MEDLHGYSQYSYLVIFDVDRFGGIEIWGSSNRAVSLSRLLFGRDYRALKKERGLRVKDPFLRYFELHSKGRDQLTAVEKQTLSSIVEHLKNVKTKLLEKCRMSLETSQIIVMRPLLVDWDIRMLQALFLEAEWITAEDSATKLMLVPSIETRANALQMSGSHKYHLEREGKYMILYMQPSEDERKVIYTSVCFQMQCAKELVAVSKRLACGDFLLVPSVLSSRTVCLRKVTENVVLDAVKGVINNFRNNHKDYYAVQITGSVSSPAVRLASEVLRITHSEYTMTDKKLSDILPPGEFKSYDLEELGDEQIAQFFSTLSQDTKIQQHSTAVCDLLQTCLDEYGFLKGAPDGIRSIFLIDDRSDGYFYSFCIEKALLQARIVNREDMVMSVRSRYQISRMKSAIQRSLKITQIANALLPPVIHNEDESAEASPNSSYENDRSLLPLNSFYLQANIGERQIHFILNKVVKEPSSTSPIGLFTAQECTVEIQDLQALTSGNMWSHYQQLELDGHLDALISCCPQHGNIALSLAHYQCFIASMTDLIDSWFRNKKTLSNDELDVYHLISINKECACALKITHRMLVETGLRPVITSITETIVGTTLSSNHFGLYQLSALFVKGGADAIDNGYYSHFFQLHLQESLERVLRSHRQKLTTFLVNEEAEHALSQYLVRGSYMQIASLNYTITLEIDTDRNTFACGLLDNRLNASKDLPGSYCKVLKESRKFEAEFTILNKDEDFPATGVERNFLTPKCIRAVIGCNISSSSRVSTDPIPVSELPRSFYGNYTYFTINILPVHHSSALRISVSTITQLNNGAATHHSTSVDIQERLSLKRNKSLI